jgi:hypothetical protein
MSKDKNPDPVTPENPSDYPPRHGALWIAIPCVALLALVVAMNAC